MPHDARPVAAHPWSIPEIGFSDAHIDAAKRVLVDRFGAPDGVELAYLGGSLAVGLGNDLSDLDLFVVGTNLGDQDQVYEQDGQQVQVIPLRADKVRQLVQLGTEFRERKHYRSPLSGDLKTLMNLVRLATGRVLLASPEWTRELNRINRDSLRQSYATVFANQFAGYAEDACGALRSGDLLTALTASALAVENAGEATLAVAGDLYFGPKFLYRRLARTWVTAPWLPYLWQLTHHELTPRTHSAAQVTAVIEERLLAGNALLACSVLDGWEHPLTVLPEPGPYPTALIGPGPRRSPFVAPIRFVDSLVLVGPEGTHEVSETMLGLWRRLDGRSLTQLHTTLSHSEPALARLQLDDVWMAVLAYADYGLAEIPDSLREQLPATPPGGVHPSLDVDGTHQRTR